MHATALGLQISVQHGCTIPGQRASDAQALATALAPVDMLVAQSQQGRRKMRTRWAQVSNLERAIQVTFAAGY